MSDTQGGSGAPQFTPTQWPQAPQIQGLPLHGQHIPSNHAKAQSHFDFMDSKRKLVEQMDQGFEKLLAKGMDIQPEDVIDEAADLIDKGADPQALAGQLAQMPTSGGEALYQWVEQLAQGIEASIQNVHTSHEQARHGLAVSSLHQLMHSELSNQGQGAAPPSPPPPPADGSAAA